MPDPVAPAAPERPTLRGFWDALPRSARWLLVTVVAGSLGRGLVTAFTVIYLHEVRGIALDTAGVLVALAGVVAVAATTVGGPVIDHVGARATLIAVQLFAIVGNLLLTFVSSIAVATLAFALLGASFGLSWPSQNTMASSLVGGITRQLYFGVNFAMVNLGIGIGGVVSGFVVDVDRLGTFQAMFLADAALLCIPLAVLLGPLRRVHGRVPPSGDARGTTLGYGPLVRDRALRWVVAMSLVVSLIGYGQFEVGMPVFARQVSEVSTFTLGLAFGVNTAVIVLLQFAVMRWLTGRRRTRALAATAVLWAVAWMMFGLTGLVAGGATAAAGVVVSLGVFGVGEALMQPTSASLVNDLAPGHMRGRYNAAFSSASQAGAVVAPLASGVILGRHWSTAFVAVLLALCVVFAAIALRLEGLVSPAVNGRR